MKKIILSLILIAPCFGLAQSLTITKADTNVIANVNSTDIEGHIQIKNTTSSDLDVMVRRIDGNYNNITDNNAICWGLCFQESVSQSPYPITIPANTTDTSNFVGHVYPDGDKLIGCGPITYVFWVDGSPSDSVIFTINYCLTADFDIDENRIEKSLSVYPNPAIGKTTVSYTLDQSQNNVFELYNLLGSKVFVQNIEGAKGEFELNVSQYSKGVYYYALKTDGVLVETKKMVIK
tara:strand:- start:1569 stop:2273 length:705 start_codon:yes stop_codon:yes gene_type:complete